MSAARHSLAHDISDRGSSSSEPEVTKMADTVVPYARVLEIHQRRQPGASQPATPTVASTTEGPLSSELVTEGTEDCDDRCGTRLTVAKRGTERRIAPDRDRSRAIVRWRVRPAATRDG